MNFRYLVKSGKYRKEDLTGDRREFVRGMEMAREAAERFAETCLDGHGEGTARKMECAIGKDVMGEFGEYLDGEIAEVIVSLLDEQNAERAAGGGADDFSGCAAATKAELLGNAEMLDGKGTGGA